MRFLPFFFESNAILVYHCQDHISGSSGVIQKCYFSSKIKTRLHTSSKNIANGEHLDKFTIECAQKQLLLFVNMLSVLETGK